MHVFLFWNAGSPLRVPKNPPCCYRATCTASRMTCKEEVCLVLAPSPARFLCSYDFLVLRFRLGVTRLAGK